MLFIVTPIVGVCNCSLFYCVSLFVQSSFLLSWWGRESWLPANFVFLASRDCCVALPCDAMSLSAVCDSGIS